MWGLPHALHGLTHSCNSTMNQLHVNDGSTEPQTVAVILCLLFYHSRRPNSRASPAVPSFGSASAAMPCVSEMPHHSCARCLFPRIMAKSKGRFPAPSIVIGSAPASVSIFDTSSCLFTSLLGCLHSRLGASPCTQPRSMLQREKSSMLSKGTGLRVDPKIESGVWPDGSATSTSAECSSSSLTMPGQQPLRTAQHNGGSAPCSQKRSVAAAGSSSSTARTTCSSFARMADMSGGIVELFGAPGGLKSSNASTRTFRSGDGVCGRSGGCLAAASSKWKSKASEAALPKAGGVMSLEAFRLLLSDLVGVLISRRLVGSLKGISFVS
mmetsp:Transcript_34537/g.99097  ORF Transcript_34537/g.99097 Transcript_34537/m.99097 type:complete len:325 (+) Transcript_34537:43-1017(+)